MINDRQKERDRGVIANVLRNMVGKSDTEMHLALGANYPYSPKDREGREWWLGEIARQRGEGKAE